MLLAPIEKKLAWPELNYSWSCPELWGTMRLFKYIDSKRQCRNNIECGNDKLPVNHELARDLLLQLVPWKSMGPDGIQLRSQKYLADHHKSSLNLGKLERSQLAIVIPVFRKGDPGSHRPFSLTSLPGKEALQRSLDKLEHWQTAALQRSTQTPRVLGQFWTPQT